MAILRGLLRSIIFALMSVAYLIEASLARFVLKDLTGRRRFYCNAVSRYCRWGCVVLNVKINAINLPDPSRHFLYVGNHMGFLDILVLASLRPTLFVTSKEMRETLVLGTLCEMGGCLFVERRSRMNILGEMDEIRQALKQGFSVSLYPEGTSSDGRQVLPFKKSLLGASAGTGVAIKAMVTNYRKVNGQPMSDQWRNHIFWYGELRVVPALFRLLSVKSIEVDLSFHDEVVISHQAERRQIAATLHAVIASHYTPIL